jgi:ABC-type dipeptide/oligopeptide/nickel transport system ATPase component
MDQKRQDRLTPIKGSPPSLLNLPPGCPFTPRCPIAEDICDREEPALEPVPGTDHSAACHFRNRTADVQASDIFADEPHSVGGGEEVATS